VDTPTLSARLLGSPSFVRDGLRVDVPGSCQPVLTYLLLQRNRRAQRPALASLIAPEDGPSTARHRLNTAVWRLRRSLDVGTGDRPQIIVSDGQGLAFSSECAIWVDVLEFETGCARSRRPVENWDEEDALIVATAVEMYRGALLEGLYDDWVLEQRSRLADLHRTALARLAQWHRRLGDLEPAIGYAERAVATEPLREDLQRLLIGLFLEAGLDELAAAQYQRCRALLAAELDIEPLPETQRLGEAALGGSGNAENVDVPQALADLRDAQAELATLAQRIGRSIAALTATASDG
jgi:DNA-binding SARP family transcriptional activator